MDERTRLFLKFLSRGGDFAYLWTPNTGDYYLDPDTGERRESAFSMWYPVHVDPILPAHWRKKNTYFGVHPSRDHRTEKQRNLLETVAAINCFFSEYDIGKGGWESKDQVIKHLETLPMLPSVIVDSGGGIHAYWLLAMPYMLIDHETMLKVRFWQHRWVDTYTKGDGAAKDLTRVLRLPGTENRKAAYAPAFPKVEFKKYDLDITYSIDELVQFLPGYVAYAPRNPDGSIHVNGTGSGYALAALEHECNDLNSTIDGNRNDRLNIAAYNLGQLVGGGALDETFVVEQLTAIAQRIGLGSSEAKNTINSGLRAGRQKPRGVPEKNQGQAATETAVAVADNPTTPIQTDSEDRDDNGLSELDRWIVRSGYDDEGHAQVFNRLHGYSFRYTDIHGFLSWDGKHWDREMAERSLNLQITSTLARRRFVAGRAGLDEKSQNACKQTNARKNAVKGQIKDIIHVSADLFDSQPYLLNVQNGVVDLRTGKLLAHGPSDYFTHVTNAPYDPKADLTPWLNFYAGVADRYDLLKDWYQMAMGYSITGSTQEEKLFYILGPARSGKGTFTAVALATLGKPLSKGVTFDLFTMEQKSDPQNFMLATLKGARFIAASEGQKGKALREDLLKRVTGSDPFMASHKHQDPFEMYLHAKIWLSSNFAPKGDVEDDAFWGRIHVINFPNSFLGTEDVSMKERMANDPAMQKAFLKWAIDGAVMWTKNGGLGVPADIKANTQKHRDALDNVGAWIEESCIVGEGYRATTKDLYASYSQWCEDTGAFAKRNVEFGRALGNKGYTQTSFRKDSIKVERGWSGLTLIEP